MLESVQTMEGNIQRLMEVHNQNLNSVKAAFLLNDLHLFTQRRITNDMALGCAKFAGYDEGAAIDWAARPSIDFEWYAEQYVFTMHMIGLVRGLKSLYEPKPKAPPHVLGTVDGEPPAPADDYSFGGDYGGTQASESSSAP